MHTRAVPCGLSCEGGALVRTAKWHTCGCGTAKDELVTPALRGTRCHAGSGCRPNRGEPVGWSYAPPSKYHSCGCGTCWFGGRRPVTALVWSDEPGQACGLTMRARDCVASTLSGVMQAWVYTPVFLHTQLATCPIAAGSCNKLSSQRAAPAVNKRAVPVPAAATMNDTKPATATAHIWQCSHDRATRVHTATDTAGFLIQLNTPAIQHRHQRSQLPACRLPASPCHTLSPNPVCLYRSKALYACIPHRMRHTPTSEMYRMLCNTVCPQHIDHRRQQCTNRSNNHMP